MITTILKLLKLAQGILKNREIISYLFFGVCTTIVNTICYRSLESLGLSTLASTFGAWFIAVIFAFLTNRKYVFRRDDTYGKKFLGQLLAFLAARSFTGALDLVIMYFAVDVYGFDGTLSKLASNVVVIVLNYLLSKLLVFRKKPELGDETPEQEDEGNTSEG